MFNISFGEISIVLIVAALFFGVDEIKSALKFFQSTQNKAKELRKKLDTEIRAIQSDIVDEIDGNSADSTSSEISNQNCDSTTKTIVDLDGNTRVCYSLENVQDKLKKVVNQSANEEISHKNQIDDTNNAS